MKNNYKAKNMFNDWEDTADFGCNVLNRECADTRIKHQNQLINNDVQPDGKKFPYKKMDFKKNETDLQKDAYDSFEKLSPLNRRKVGNHERNDLKSPTKYPTYTNSDFHPKPNFTLENKKFQRDQAFYDFPSNQEGIGKKFTKIGGNFDYKLQNDFRQSGLDQHVPFRNKTYPFIGDQTKRAAPLDRFDHVRGGGNHRK